VGSVIPLAIILGLWVSDALDRGARRGALALAGAALFCASSASGALAISAFRRPTYYASIGMYDRFSRAGDMLIVRDLWPYAPLTYYGGRRVAILDYYRDEGFRSLDRERIEGMMRETYAAGGRVYLTSPREVPFYPGREDGEREFFGSYRIRPVAGVGDAEGMTVWEISPAGP
jgi:hypothetical protein